MQNPEYHDIGSPPSTSAGDGSAALMLDEQGNIQDWDSAAEVLFGYPREELARRHVSMLLPQLAAIDIFENGILNPRLRYLCRIGVQFQGLCRSGQCLVCDLFLSDLHNPCVPRLRMVVHCRSSRTDRMERLGPPPAETNAQ